jgi:hypothetical protein
MRIGHIRRLVVQRLVAFGDWSHYRKFGDWSFGEWSFEDWLFGDWSFGEWSFGDLSVDRNFISTLPFHNTKNQGIFFVLNNLMSSNDYFEFF